MTPPPLGNNDSIEMNHKTNVACDNGSIEMNIKSNTEFNDACDYAPEKKSRRVLEKMITCPVCRKEMCSRSLPRHYRNIHNKEIENVVYCVDKIRGLYMVRRSSKGGVFYPIHIKKNLSKISLDFGVDCEDSACRDYMYMAWRSGMTGAECRHLRLVGVDTKYPESETLNDTYLSELSIDGKYKIIKPTKIEQCLDLKKMALNNKSKLLYAIHESTRFIMFSLYNGEYHYYSKFGRIILTADIQEGNLDCRCCKRKHSCVHKCVCMWYLVQNNLFEGFREPRIEDNDETVNVQHQNISLKYYPPIDTQILEKMCQYLKELKRIPHSANNRASKTIYPTTYIPVEVKCFYCDSDLQKPILISKHAKILTMTELLGDISTYYKECPKCKVCYRYQEFTDGLHNFNDIFFMSLEICYFITKSFSCSICPLGVLLTLFLRESGLN
uniref:uncharacterized protein LOC120343514 n=1 Tax=Styela clava TaxID=7725 RepID=UPI001939AA2A|nr:uncharacterized protein LOC120343514 [Styela clava]